MTISLAQRIKYWRTFAQLSKADLARALDVHPSNVTFWEKEKGEKGATSPRDLAALARACGVEMQTFYGPIPVDGLGGQADSDG